MKKESSVDLETLSSYTSSGASLKKTYTKMIKKSQIIEIDHISIFWKKPSLWKRRGMGQQDRKEP